MAWGPKLHHFLKDAGLDAEIPELCGFWIKPSVFQEMMILDTNVLSALMSREPDKRVILWLDKQPRTSIWTTSVTVLEVRLVCGKCRQESGARL